MPDKGMLERLLSWGEGALSSQDQHRIHQPPAAPEGAVTFLFL